LTIEVNDEIANGKSKTYEVRADIISAERTDETYTLYIRNTTDLTVIEKESGFSAPVDLSSAPLADWGLVTVK
jgi:archaellum component FlaG (FlaF/FlaG flagellin family)